MLLFMAAQLDIIGDEPSIWKGSIPNGNYPVSCLIFFKSLFYFLFFSNLFFLFVFKLGSSLVAKD